MYEAKMHPEFPIIFQMRTKYFGAEKPLIFEDLKATKEYKVHSSTERAVVVQIASSKLGVEPWMYTFDLPSFVPSLRDVVP